jgi:hypothetical protein
VGHAADLLLVVWLVSEIGKSLNYTRIHTVKPPNPTTDLLLERRHPGVEGVDLLVELPLPGLGLLRQRALRPRDVQLLFSLFMCV